MLESPTGELNVDMSAAPDVTFDDLFPAENTLEQPTTAAPPSTEATTTAPPASQPEGFYIKTSTGTVYKSQEDTVKGIEHKDRTIEQLRAKYREATGRDPLTEEPKPAPRRSYLADDKAYYKDMSEAVSKGDTRRFLEINRQLAQEVVNEQVGPYAPVLQRVSRQEALSDVNSKIKGFQEFVNTEEYSKILDERPALAQAIKFAESDPRFRYRQNQDGSFADSLPELYQLVYDSAQARKVPELLKQGPRVGTAPTQTPPRPTMSTSSIAPGEPTNENDENWTSIKGLQAIQKSAERRGVLDFKW